MPTLLTAERQRRLDWLRARKQQRSHKAKLQDRRTKKFRNPPKQEPILWGVVDMAPPQFTRLIRREQDEVRVPQTRCCQRALRPLAHVMRLILHNRETGQMAIVRVLQISKDAVRVT